MISELFKSESEREKIMMHVDYDKDAMVFYTNFYFSDCNYVLKTPIASLEDEIIFDEYKIEKFDLLKYSYLLYF